MRPAGPVYRFNSHSSGPGTCLHPSRTQGAKGRRLAPSRATGPARHPKAPPAGRHRPSQPRAPGPRPPGPAGRRPSTRKARARCPQQAGRWQCSTRASDQDTDVNIHARASMSTNNLKQGTRNCRAATRQGEDTATRKGNKAIHLYRISCL